MLGEADPQRIGPFHAACPGAEEVRQSRKAGLHGGEDLGGAFPNTDEEFENGIDRRAGVGLRVGAPAAQVALEEEFHPQMGEHSAPVEPSVAGEKRLRSCLDSREGLFDQSDVAGVDGGCVSAEEWVVFSEAQLARMFGKQFAGLLQPMARGGFEFRMGLPFFDSGFVFCHGKNLSASMRAWPCRCSC